MYTHRQKPCFTWVSTGACPFGERCGGIHDPRIQGPVEAVLSLREKFDLRIGVDSMLYVDERHQSIVKDIHEEGLLTSPSMTFNQFVSIVCNDEVDNDGNPSYHDANLSLRTKIEIALVMGVYKKTDLPYKSNATFRGKACMVIHQRQFHVSLEGDLIDASRSNSNRCTPNLVVTAHHIMFDLWTKTKDVPRRLLWFNLPSQELVPFQGSKVSTLASVSVEYLIEEYDNFKIISTSMNVENDLIEDVLYHRLLDLKATAKPEYTCEYSIQENNAAMLKIASRFVALQRHFQYWSWPRNLPTIDFAQQEPEVLMKYQPPQFLFDDDSEKTYTDWVWTSFVDGLDCRNIGEESCRLNGFPTLLNDESNGSKEQLKGFCHQYHYPFTLCKTSVGHTRSDVCWHSLLLHAGPRDWDVIVSKERD